MATILRGNKPTYYNIDKIKMNEDGSFPDFVTATFEYDENGTLITLGFYTKGCNNINELISRAMSKLGDFDRIKFS